MEPIRPVIAGTWLVVVLLMIAPWFTGGREPVAMLVGAFSLLLGAFFAWRNGGSGLKPGPLLWAWLGLLVWGGLSWFWTANRYSTELWAFGWLSTGVLFALAYRLSLDEIWRQRMINGYLLLAVLFSVTGFFMYVLGDYDRFTSTMFWPNPAAAFVLPALVMGIERLTGKMNKKYTATSIALVVIVGTAFMLTSSRAAFAVFGFILAIFLVLARHTRRSWINILFSLAGIVCLSFGLNTLALSVNPDRQGALGGGRFTEVVSGQSQSGKDRIEYVRSAVAMWWDAPLAGVGAGAYKDVHPRYQTTVQSASAHAHNWYVEVLAELGIVGAMLLAGTLFWLLVGCLKGMLVRKGTIGLFLGWAGLLMHFGLDIDAAYPSLMYLAAVLAAVMFSQFGAIRYGRSYGLLLFGGGIAALMATTYYQSQAALSRGLVYQDRADYATAITELDRGCGVILCDPDTKSKEAINRLAAAVDGDMPAGRRAQELDLALLQAREAVALDAFDGQHEQLAGRILERKNDPVAAEAAFRRALAKDGLNRPDYALDLARLLERQDRFDEAMSVVNDMLSKYPPAVVDNRQAAVTLRSNLAGLATIKGRIAVSRGDVAAAQAALRQARDLDRNVPAVQFLQDRIQELVRAQ